MKKFVFKQEPLYEFRKLLEELSQVEFAAALKRLDEEESKLSFLKGIYRKSSEEADGLKEKGAPVSDIRMYHDYLSSVKRHIAAQEAALKELREFFEKKRGELLEASRNKKVLETMKEKSYNDHIMHMEKLEQKITDDMVSSRFKRSGRDEV